MVAANTAAKPSRIAAIDHVEVPASRYSAIAARIAIAHVAITGWDKPSQERRAISPPRM
jgi:plasmid replication initiation protein